MSEVQHGWVDDLPVSGRAATNLGYEYDSVEDMIEAYRQAEDLTDIRRIGRKTAQDLREYIHEEDPDAERVRHENDEGICTEFTTDHGIENPVEGIFHFAFICPRCGSKNALQGHPDGFKNKPFGCTSCRWVSLLEAGAIERFIEEAGIDE